MNHVPADHGYRRWQIFGGAKNFCPNFPKLARKVFVRLCLQIFSHEDHEDLFWHDLQKKVFRCFSANVRRHVLTLNNVGCHFCPDFQGFAQCQAKFLTSSKVLTYYCLSVILLLRVKKLSLAISFLMCVV